jgi:predicted HicB family RNase H-like nuclease
MEYKGYLGKITYDDKAKIFHGEVIGLKDIITFQGKSANELKKAFQDSIDDYLAWYKERGEQPEKDITFVCFDKLNTNG